MTLPMPFPVDTTDARDPGETRAARLLRGMHKVFSHDLPNQMVVLQSLLQLLQMEESERLSADGREYVERLGSAARKTAGMVRFLKEMGRLHSYQPQFEEVPLVALARELRAELNQLYPGRTLEYTWDWKLPGVRLDYRPFLQAVLELLQLRVEAAGGAACQVLGMARDQPPWVVLDFRVQPVPARANLDQRLEIVLAREWLASGGAELILNPEEAGRFSILVPR